MSTAFCAWKCGAHSPADHHPTCPTRTGPPLAGTGWLKGLGYCHLAYGDNRKGRCGWCGRDRPQGRRRWCSDRCSAAFARNHWWTDTRFAALDRDGHRCVRCQRGPGNYRLLRGVLAVFGIRPDYSTVATATLEAWTWFCATDGGLEVNHIVPILGRHAEGGCHHHLDGVEVLCHGCHLTETRRQRRAGWRVEQPAPVPLALAL